MVKIIRQYQHSYLWLKELQDILRGISGGFLFGIPLMYTMEVWWIGSHVEPPLLLGALVATYLVVFLLNRTDGFRNRNSNELRDDAMDSVEALAIGIICTTFMLILLRRITWNTSLDEMLGKVIFEGVPFSIGVALSRAILNGDRIASNQVQETKPKIANQSHNQSHNQSQRNKVNVKETMGDISATLIGAIIVAFNIAPTDEIPMLAAATSPPWLIAILVSSLLISYNIVFVAGFINQHKRHQQLGLFQTPETETVICYLVSLLASVLMLWFFHQLSFSDPWFLWLRYTLLLGLPATVGGAAGRIAI